MNEDKGPLLSLDEATGLIFINRGHILPDEAEQLLKVLPAMIIEARGHGKRIVTKQIQSLEKRLVHLRKELETL